MSYDECLLSELEQEIILQYLMTKRSPDWSQTHTRTHPKASWPHYTINSTIRSSQNTGHVGTWGKNVNHDLPLPGVRLPSLWSSTICPAGLPMDTRVRGTAHPPCTALWNITTHTHSCTGPQSKLTVQGLNAKVAGLCCLKQVFFYCEKVMFNLHWANYEKKKNTQFVL